MNKKTKAKSKGNKKARKDNLVEVAKYVVNNFDGEIVAKDNKVDNFENAVYDTDVLNTDLIITGLKFAKEGEIKGKKVQYFILTATKKSGEVIKILTNHAYVELIANHLRDKGTGLRCQIKYNKDREFYYLVNPDVKAKK